MHTMPRTEVSRLAAEAELHRPMTASEFRTYWLARGEDNESSLLENAEENLGERESQFASECAMFGDAGPGQGYTINCIRTELSQVRRVLALTGGV